MIYQILFQAQGEQRQHPYFKEPYGLVAAQKQIF